MVSWNSSLSGMCDVLSTDYSLRYRLSGSTGDYTTVNTSDTSVTLVDLVPNAEYDVEVAAINSNGAMSNFSAVAQFTVPPQEAEPSKILYFPIYIVIICLLFEIQPAYHRQAMLYSCTCAFTLPVSMYVCTCCYCSAACLKFVCVTCKDFYHLSQSVLLLCACHHDTFQRFHLQCIYFWNIFTSVSYSVYWAILE